MPKLIKINGGSKNYIDEDLKRWQEQYNSELEETEIKHHMPPINLPEYSNDPIIFITGIYLDEEDFTVFKLTCGHLINDK